ncbi:unnamed protein product [Urochloa humidicola]
MSDVGWQQLGRGCGAATGEEVRSAGVSMRIAKAGPGATEHSAVELAGALAPATATLASTSAASGGPAGDLTEPRCSPPLAVSCCAVNLSKQERGTCVEIRYFSEELIGSGFGAKCSGVTRTRI